MKMAETIMLIRESIENPINNKLDHKDVLYRKEIFFLIHKI
jgi:hypothetical protein